MFIGVEKQRKNLAYYDKEIYAALKQRKQCQVNFAQLVDIQFEIFRRVGNSF